MNDVDPVITGTAPLPLGDWASNETTVVWLPTSKPYQSMLNGQLTWGSLPLPPMSLPSTLIVPLLPAGCPPAVPLAVPVVITNVLIEAIATSTVVASRRLR